MLKKHPKRTGQRHVPLSSMKVAEIRMRPPPAPRLFGAPVPAKGIPTPQKMGGAYFAPHMLHLGTSWIFHTSKIPHLLPAARPSCHGAKGSPWTKAKRRVSWASSVQPLAVPASHQGIYHTHSEHQVNLTLEKTNLKWIASVSRNANLCRIWSIVNSMTSYSLIKKPEHYATFKIKEATCWSLNLQHFKQGSEVFNLLTCDILSIPRGKPCLLSHSLHHDAPCNRIVSHPFLLWLAPPDTIASQTTMWSSTLGCWPEPPTTCTASFLLNQSYPWQDCLKSNQPSTFPSWVWEVPFVPY